MRLGSFLASFQKMVSRIDEASAIEGQAQPGDLASDIARQKLLAMVALGLGVAGFGLIAAGKMMASNPKSPESETSENDTHKPTVE